MNNYNKKSQNKDEFKIIKNQFYNVDILPIIKLGFLKFHPIRFNFRNIVIEDHIKGDFKSAITRYHLHPNLELSQRDEYNWTACLSDNEQKIYIKMF